MVALLLGTPFIALMAVTPIALFFAVLYHSGLLIWLIQDVRRLPGRGARAERVFPVPFSLGAEEQVEVRVTVPGAAGCRAQVSDHAPRELRASPRVLAGRLDGQGELTLSYRVASSTRGSYPFGTLDVRCWRPAGFWARQLSLAVADVAVVQPDILAVRSYELYARRGLAAFPGMRRARLGGASTAFASLRDYVPGDDVRRISWKATARRDSPVTAEYEAERGQQLLVLIDCGRLMTAPAGALSKLDHAVNACLLLSWVGLRHGDRVGLMTFDERVERFEAPRRGPRTLSRINSLLARAEAKYVEPDFRSALAYAGRRLTRRSLIVVLTDLWDRESSAELVRNALWLGRRHLVVVVAMADPELEAARREPVGSVHRVYEWAAAEELLGARRESFEVLQRGGVLGIDVSAGALRATLVERYLELKERALL